jgi:hypothetical protein
MNSQNYQELIRDIQEVAEEIFNDHPACQFETEPEMVYFDNDNFGDIWECR